MNPSTEKKTVRCAIYTRKSTNEGLDQEFSSLDAQREAAQNYIASQKGEGWVTLPEKYDDGGFTGANMERPALGKLLVDIKDNKIDCVVVYKVDRLSRSLIDFAKMLELFEKQNVTFVSVTQQFNTNNSMGRLTLNILLSFAQFEREIISERTKDKMAAARKKGRWLGGHAILGYDIDKSNRTLKINDQESELVREIFELYIKERSALSVAQMLNTRGYTTKRHKTKSGKLYGGAPFKKPDVNYILNNILYSGKVRYAEQIYQGMHEPIISEATFAKAQEIMASNRVKRQANKNSEIVSLLNHLLHCKHCNKIMFPTYTLKGDKKYRYYVCNGAQKRGYKECPTRSVNAQAIEDAVITNLRNIADSVPEQTAKISAIRAQIEADLATIQQEQCLLDKSIVSLTTKAKALKESLPTKNSAKEIAALEETLKEQEQRLSSLRIKKANLNEQIITKEELQKAMVITSPLWDGLFLQEKKRVLDYLVKEVDYDGSTGLLGITLNANGIKLLCAELSAEKGQDNG